MNFSDLWRAPAVKLASRSVVILACATLACQSFAHAAPPSPIHFTITHLPKKPVTAGGVFTFVVSARIDPGWHMYALDEPDGGPQPTEVGLAAADPLTLLDVKAPVPRTEPDPVTHQSVGLFQNSADFTLRVQAPSGALPAAPVSHILVRYQTCNQQVCLPPRTESIPLPLSGVVAGVR